MYRNIPTDQVQHHIIKPPFLVDEVSSTEFYIGTSQNTSDQTKSTWRIQRIWQVGTVWYTGYPNGDQDFKYQWSNRFGYTYEQ